MKRVLNGDLAPGARLKEVSLAESLGVSRTPLREALRDLEHMGIVSCTPGRGYAVRDLCAEEVRDTFPMLVALEELALSLAHIDDELIERLDTLSRSVSGPANVCPIEMDLAWHEALTASTTNERLNHVILELQACAQRYECTCVPADAQTSLREEHMAISRTLKSSLASGDRTEAGQLLRRHRDHVMGVVLETLERQQASHGVDPVAIGARAS